MADEPTNPPAPETEPPAPADDQRVPYERFQQANKKAKEAADRAKALEAQMSELQQQIEERETAGLPELDRMKKDLERAAKRAEEAEKRAEDHEKALTRSARERWVTAAAQAQNFADPSDASAFLDLDAIEDEKDAERAVKRLAGSKKHLLKAEEPTLPGRVIANGQRVPADGSPADADRAAAEGFLAEINKMRAGGTSGGSLFDR